VLDLKNKVGKIFFGAPVARSSAAVALAGNLLEVETALLALGYKRPDIHAAIEPLRTRKDAAVEDLLREALRRLTR
jgi:Holliday junction resolvasome RuvABC DNA-binding subunit